VNILKQSTKAGTVFLIDGIHPEDGAMMQALYSRSAESVETHAAKVQASGSGNFMQRFYVGYNHKSIGDCGSTTLFFEDVSILAAKAIQDSPLYKGQETSTRYLDFSDRRIVDPVGTPESKAIHDRWMMFYRDAAEPLADEIRRRYPRREGEDEKAYDGAVKARVFDVLRGFLPAGVTTQLSLHTDLRQAGDRLDVLDNHPLAEVNAIARTARGMLRQQYPNSFGARVGLSGVVSGTQEQRFAREQWEATVAEHLAYDGLRLQARGDEFGSTIPNMNLEPIAELLASRPRGCVLPHVLTALGQVTFDFLLDYGAWRDIQRHRNGVCEAPTLTTAYGFEPWYLDQFDDEWRARAMILIEEQEEALRKLECNSVERQYYIPLGYLVPTVVCYGLPAVVYVLEIRSGKTVHPTLRRAVHRMIEQFEHKHPLVKLHVDRDPDDWTVRRGTQTITER
jgi:thymidylate synthase ThyX